MQHYFFRSCWPFQIPAPSADNKGDGNLLSGLDIVTFVIATIIYSSYPSLFSAPRFWEPRDPRQPGFFLKARRENPGNEVAITSLKSFLSFPWRHRFCNAAPSEILAGNSFIVRCHMTSKYPMRAYAVGKNFQLYNNDNSVK